MLLLLLLLLMHYDLTDLPNYFTHCVDEVDEHSKYKQKKPVDVDSQDCLMSDALSRVIIHVLTFT